MNIDDLVIFLSIDRETISFIDDALSAEKGIFLKLNKDEHLSLIKSLSRGDNDTYSKLSLVISRLSLVDMQRVFSELIRVSRDAASKFISYVGNNLDGDSENLISLKIKIGSMYNFVGNTFNDSNMIELKKTIKEL